MKVCERSASKRSMLSFRPSGYSMCQYVIANDPPCIPAKSCSVALNVVRLSKYIDIYSVQWDSCSFSLSWWWSQMVQQVGWSQWMRGVTPPQSACRSTREPPPPPPP
mmetsp:Transcript_6271/g.11150  ORF Transcript_6271/g.11150 Transcript_6271/m.11150 type:complete len:107 (-) Transcript_6271:1744-2064(-)